MKPFAKRRSRRIVELCGKLLATIRCAREKGEIIEEAAREMERQTKDNYRLDAHKSGW